MKRKKYLNNKDLLKEIHLSKSAYCSFINDETDRDYDIIINDLSEIDEELISKAISFRAIRLKKQQYEEKISSGEKNIKILDIEIDESKILKQDIVFRVMTYDHIPNDNIRKKNPKTVADRKVKLNFLPFQHFRFNDDDDLVCVGKSHWHGGVHNGYFSKDHGQITNNLAMMYMKMCERYASRGNIRNYSYNDEMRDQSIFALIESGLKFNEAKSDNPFAYLTSIISNCITGILNVEKRNQDTRDDILEINNMTPSYTRQHNNEWNT